MARRISRSFDDLPARFGLDAPGTGASCGTATSRLFKLYASLSRLVEALDLPAAPSLIEYIDEAPASGANAARWRPGQSSLFASTITSPRCGFRGPAAGDADGADDPLLVAVGGAAVRQRHILLYLVAASSATASSVGSASWTTSSAHRFGRRRVIVDALRAAACDEQQVRRHGRCVGPRSQSAATSCRIAAVPEHLVADPITRAGAVRGDPGLRNCTFCCPTSSARQHPAVQLGRRLAATERVSDTTSTQFAKVGGPDAVRGPLPAWLRHRQLAHGGRQPARRYVSASASTSRGARSA